MATDHCLPTRTLEFQTTDSSPSTGDMMRTPDGGLSRSHSNANLTVALPDGKVVLDAMSKLLHTAENELSQLERDNILGTAVIRACAEIADVVAHLAAQLEDQTDVERRHFAAACLQDFQSSSSDSLRLTAAEDIDGLAVGNSTSLVVAPDLTEDDVMGAMGKVAILLRDVEFSLRAIDADDASDLADTALIVAQLGLTALRNVHEQLVHHVQRSEGEDGTVNGDRGASKWKGSPNITLLTDDDDELDDAHDTLEPERTSLTSQRSSQRIRCLWPPIAPEVMKFVDWSKCELQKQNWLVTASLGIAFWPILTATAVIGSSAVVADNLLQGLYRHWEDTPLITSAEYAATSVYQSSKLTLLSAKAVAKPTLRVAHRQWQRHSPGLHAWAVDKVQHPVQTVCEATQGASWCLQQVCGAVSDKWNEWHLHQQEQRQSLSLQSERNKCAQDLHL